MNDESWTSMIRIEVEWRELNENDKNWIIMMRIEWKWWELKLYDKNWNDKYL